jgi:hypothetical protein
MAKRDLRQFKNERRLKKEDIAAAARQAHINADLNAEPELMGDLEKMIAQGRRDGTFNDEMLDAFIKNVSPMMDGAQRKKLESIARAIRMNRM